MKTEEISYLMKKHVYFNNLDQSIKIYNEQCNNIDLSEAEVLIKKINEIKIYSFKNPFIKEYEEERKYIESNQENFMYKNIPKQINYQIIDNSQIGRASCRERV